MHRIPSQPEWVDSWWPTPSSPSATQGLRLRDFLTIMHRLKQDMARQYGPYHKREACRRFIAWVDGAGARVHGTPRVKATSSVELTEAAAASLSASPGRRMFSPDPPHGKGEVAIPEAEAATARRWCCLRSCRRRLRRATRARARARARARRLRIARRMVWPLHLVDLGDAEQVEPLFELPASAAAASAGALLPVRTWQGQKS